MFGTSLRIVRCTVYALARYPHRCLSLIQTYQTLPWILIQESHSYIKRRTAPAFKRVRIGECPTRLLGDIGYINRAQTGCEQRLVRVAPCSVHNECAGVLAYGLGESFWSFLDDNVPPTIFAGG